MNGVGVGAGVCERVGFEFPASVEPGGEPMVPVGVADLVSVGVGVGPTVAVGVGVAVAVAVGVGVG
jgi:hypothetical protein